MTETRDETQIVGSEDVPMVTIIREFDAAPDKVFRATPIRTSTPSATATTP